MAFNYGKVVENKEGKTRDEGKKKKTKRESDKLHEWGIKKRRGTGR